jgi:hypothetical protein
VLRTDVPSPRALIPSTLSGGLALTGIVCQNFMDRGRTSSASDVVPERTMRVLVPEGRG